MIAWARWKRAMASSRRPARESGEADAVRAVGREVAGVGRWGGRDNGKVVFTLHAVDDAQIGEVHSDLGMVIAERRLVDGQSAQVQRDGLRVLILVAEGCGGQQGGEGRVRRRRSAKGWGTKARPVDR